MSSAMALSCRVLPGSESPCLRWQPVASRDIARDEVRVRVKVASVNPIDVKRGAGHGRRLLSLLGAGDDELVLGNDFSGEVVEVGSDVLHASPGDRVWGLVPTGPQGAHRSEVCVKSKLVRQLPPGILMASAAVLPYTFTTVWRCLKALGLTESNAMGRHVLIHGAGGALGQLATQLLVRWGAAVTAVCGPTSMARCADLGATRVVDRFATSLCDLPADCDATLNFGAWSDEANVLGRLHSASLGHASTVHPLLATIDAQGWWAGGVACWSTWQAMRRRVHDLAPRARYVWTIFQPDEDAMNALQAAFLSRPFVLEVAHRTHFSQAHSAFRHAAQGCPTRAVLMADL